MKRILYGILATAAILLVGCEAALVVAVWLGL